MDVTNSTSPIPKGLYPTWCVDETVVINPPYTVVPGALYSGTLYSTCDPNLNSELPPGHPNTLVSPAVWQMVNYILNHATNNGTNVFYYDEQAAINTLVGSDAGSPNPCGGLYTTPVPEGGCASEGYYPVYNASVVQALLTAATNNAAAWVPECGDVIGAIWVTATDNEYRPVPFDSRSCSLHALHRSEQNGRLSRSDE